MDSKDHYIYLFLNKIILNLFYEKWDDTLCEDEKLDYGALDLGELAQSQTIKLEGELRGSPHPSPHGQWNYP